MITVIAGVNGAGKSSVAGASIRNRNGDYFNPDEVARELMKQDPELSLQEANGKAWQMGFDQLKRAISEDADYTFETTLGGSSICELLHQALDTGREIRVFYCGLNSPELHIARVEARVKNGGHHIPEEKIRERWTNSVHNLMGLIDRCFEVIVYDNSTPANDIGPQPICLFHLRSGQFIRRPIEAMPEWAMPLASVAIKRAIED